MAIAPNTDDWMDAADLPDCDGTDEGGLLCTISGNWSDNNARFAGTVIQPDTGEQATIKATCNFKAATFLGFTITLPEQSGWLPQVDMAGGGGKLAVDCAFSMRASDTQRSVLTGRFYGNGALENVDTTAATVRLSHSFIVEVLGGSGKYAGEVGTGTFNGNINFSLLGTSGELPIDFEVVSLGGHDARAASVKKTGSPASLAMNDAGDSTGSIDLNLRAGRPGVRIVSPARVKRSQIQSALHAVTTPRASCHLAASRSGRTVDLGTSRAGDDGSVKFSSRLAKKLDRGAWRVSAKCTSSEGSAKSARRVMITR
ncbi:MAG TPA: hypothetical protein VGO97_05060 [Solirubrobacterales bacterium]|nr:hypothetical protein [Solirubrobacterales bacterium]